MMLHQSEGAPYWKALLLQSFTHTKVSYTAALQEVRLGLLFCLWCNCWRDKLIFGALERCGRVKRLSLAVSWLLDTV